MDQSITGVIGTLIVPADSIADVKGDNSSRIITVHNLEAENVFNSKKLEPIAPGSGFTVSVDGNPAQFIFMVTEVLEYLAYEESGYIYTLRIKGYSFFQNPRLGSIPELPIGIGLVLSHRTALGVQFYATPDMEATVQSKYGHITQNGVIYKMVKILRRYINIIVDTTTVESVAAGYTAIYSRADIPVEKDIEDMVNIMGKQTY